MAGALAYIVVALGILGLTGYVFHESHSVWSFLILIVLVALKVEYKGK